MSILPLLMILFHAIAQAQRPPFEVPPINEPDPSWTRTASVELTAPRENRSGAAWDFALDTPFICVPGTPLCSGAPKSASTYPDMWLLVFDAAGNYTGYLTRPETRIIQDGGFIRRWMEAQGFKAYARCPNALVCAYPEIKLPAKEFGIVILDQDLWAHDAMLAAVLYTPGQTDEVTVDAIQEHIQNYLKHLISLKQLDKAAPFLDALPARAISKCEREVCFADEIAGLPGFRITTMQQVAPGLRCTAAAVTGSVEPEPIQGSTVTLKVNQQSSTCGSNVTYLWDFGDGGQAETSEPIATHRYDAKGVYPVKVTPRCHRTGRACEMPLLTVDIELK
ncbi:MAG: PKD domain-containing protein [Bryobacterales bacterium]|nr:PKD domain-containing protein [Bryobacterales bacterium]